jgi:hypothetical protein
MVIRVQNMGVRVKLVWGEPMTEVGMLLCGGEFIRRWMQMDADGEGSGNFNTTDAKSTK